MKFLTLALASAALASAVSVPAKITYDGFKVYRVSVGSNVAAVKSIMSKLQLESWTGRPKANGFVDLMVPPTQVENFEADTADLSIQLMHEDLGLSIADEGQVSVYAAGSANATWFNAYHPIADHTQFLKDLQASYPSNSEIISAGKSNSGRDLTGIHIWGSGGKGSKKAIVWHGNVHAREWITSMVVEYAAYTLLTQNASDTSMKAYVDKYDFYIFPIVNPDGFAYTQTNDRMWRKNRQANSGNSCVGRDINRNWPYVWSGSGSSTDPCAEDYRGASQGDSTETKALKAQLDGLASGKGVEMYLDFHSYSQLFMYPYGYSCTAVVANSAKYASLGTGVVNAIKAVHGVSFTEGPICDTIYQVAGDGVDYATDIAKAAFSFTVELRDTGRYGFVLPAAQILPSAEEMWAGLAYLLANM
ncbi:uncharacterized protein BDZ99DRAFT_465111 [Mytilinidion resinicola]|uniref:Peptidase M14 domain-containing protein n=1 Tax=Mytilinidion resinicola TaxID=574789 RepID=A0A6A6YED6_9PEZI|nr:uncharacterized protein BDZ99DRAFT_465111 [Mytilinidion resinicola]KAF2807181.1 hypothetical protein BDZ99DRAFT_465111 [Mytilinidion resinicola]